MKHFWTYAGESGTTLKRHECCHEETHESHLNVTAVQFFR